VAKDPAAAVKWWRAAADQGDAPSQFNLGVAYAGGQGVTQNAMEAAKWYRSAADRNHTAAQVNLGTMYEQGRGVARNRGEAIRWLQKAVDLGDEESVPYLRRVQGSSG